MILFFSLLLLLLLLLLLELILFLFCSKRLFSSSNFFFFNIFIKNFSLESPELMLLLSEKIFKKFSFSKFLFFLLITSLSLLLKLISDKSDTFILFLFNKSPICFLFSFFCFSFILLTTLSTKNKFSVKFCILSSLCI